jgi:hypothetical protein
MGRRLFAVSCVLWACTSAWADKAQDALGLLDKGIAQFNAGQLAAARESFVKARDLVPDKANPYRWLGLVDARMGHCAEAVRELETFLQKVPAGDARVAEAVTLRDRCKEDVQPRMGTLVVESTPSGAEVRLDDANAVEVASTPYHNEAVPAGNHVVFVKKGGYELVTRGVAVNQHETVRVELTLKELPKTARVESTATTATQEKLAPPPKKKRYWIAGVVVGVVAAAALGVGLGVGLSTSSSSGNVFPPVMAGAH